MYKRVLTKKVTMPGGIVFRALKSLAFLFLISVTVPEIVPNWFFRTHKAHGQNKMAYLIVF